MSSVHTVFGLAVAASCCIPLSSVAADEPDAAVQLQQLKEQIAELRQGYELRLQALERRIAELQSASAKPPVDRHAPPAAAAVAEPPPAPVAAAPAGGSASAFNPAISLILAGTYANLSRDPATYRLQGFIPSGGEVGPGSRGFNLGESELGISAAIDPMFSGRLTAALASDNSVGVEEAWFEGRGLFEGGNAPRGPLPVVDRLPQRPPRAHLGLRRCAAGVPGLFRRADQDRRPAAALAGADRPLLRAGRGGRLGHDLPRKRRRPQRDRLDGALRSRRRRPRHRRQLARRRLALAALPRQRSRLRRRERALASTVSNAFTGTSAHLGAGRDLQVGARRQRAQPQPDDARRVLPAQRKRHAELRPAGAGGRTSSGSYASTQSGWYLQARLPVRAALALGRALRPARFRHAADRPGQRRHARRRPTSRSCSRARPSRSTADVRLVARPSSAACACSSPPTAAASTADRPADLPSIHHEPGCAWRAPVLGEAP